MSVLHQLRRVCRLARNSTFVVSPPDPDLVDPNADPQAEPRREWFAEFAELQSQKDRGSCILPRARVAQIQESLLACQNHRDLVTALLAVARLVVQVVSTCEPARAAEIPPWYREDGGVAQDADVLTLARRVLQDTTAMLTRVRRRWQSGQGYPVTPTAWNALVTAWDHAAQQPDDHLQPHMVNTLLSRVHDVVAPWEASATDCAEWLEQANRDHHPDVQEMWRRQMWAAAFAPDDAPDQPTHIVYSVCRLAWDALENHHDLLQITQLGATLRAHLQPYVVAWGVQPDDQLMATLGDAFVRVATHLLQQQHLGAAKRDETGDTGDTGNTDRERLRRVVERRDSSKRWLHIFEALPLFLTPVAQEASSPTWLDVVVLLALTQRHRHLMTSGEDPLAPILDKLKQHGDSADPALALRWQAWVNVVQPADRQTVVQALADVGDQYVSDLDPMSYDWKWDAGGYHQLLDSYLADVVFDQVAQRCRVHYDEHLQNLRAFFRDHTTPSSKMLEYLQQVVNSVAVISKTHVQLIQTWISNADKAERRYYVRPPRRVAADTKSAMPCADPYPSGGGAADTELILALVMARGWTCPGDGQPS